MNKRLKDILIALGMIFLYFFYTTIALIILLLFKINVSNMNTFAKIIFLLVTEASFILIMLLVYKKDTIKDFDDFKKHYKEYFNEYIKYWFILLLLMYSSNFLILIIQKLFHHKEVIANNEKLVREILDKYPFYLIISAVLLGPLEEELVFRKAIKKIFNNKWVFIIISGLFFGAVHVVFDIKDAFDLLYIISYSIPGFIFAYVYEKSNNIFVSTGLHTIHNGVLIALQILLSLI